jgi:hypothetical protein
MKLWLKDPKTGKESVTLSMFVYGFGIATIKLLLAGIEIYDKIKMSEFSGTDYAAVLAALGAVYTIRKNKSIKSEKEEIK